MFKSKKAREEEAAQLEAKRQAVIARQKAHEEALREQQRQAEINKQQWAERRAAEDKEKAERQARITAEEAKKAENRARLEEELQDSKEQLLETKRAVFTNLERLEQEHIVSKCTQWEYQTVTTDVNDYGDTYQFEILGKKGWELVASFNYEYGELYDRSWGMGTGYVFKRPLIPIPQDVLTQFAQEEQRLREQIEKLEQQVKDLEQELKELK